MKSAKCKMKRAKVKKVERVNRMEEKRKEKNNIEVIKQSGWIWLLNRDIVNPKEVNQKITGKYLFFSKDKNKLIELAKVILKKFKLSVAKVPLTDRPIGEDFVLCVYDKEPRFKYELRGYADEVDIMYRYWKSDVDTLKGKYSKQFLNSLHKCLPTKNHN